MAGRGRGRGRKKSVNKTEALPAAAAPPGAAASDAEEKLVAVHHHASRSMMMTTPLGALMRIEATIWMNARGGGIISLDDFYSMTRAHEWLGLQHAASNSTGGTTDKTKMARTMVPKDVSKLSIDVYELINQLSEEERLLFDFVAVSAWDPTDIANLYPLYRLRSSSKGTKIQLEILQQPSKPAATATKKSNTKTVTRSEVLGNMYHHSRKYFSFSSTVGHTSTLHDWWEHAKSAAQMILNHRESMTASASKVDSVSEKTAFKALVTSNTLSVVAASPTKNNGGKKTTLEERVRARSLLNPVNVKAKQTPKMREVSLQEKQNKALLELAAALRAYSQRRGLVSSGGGGSALDRLKHRASGDAGSAHAARNIARLTVTDLVKDARLTWDSVVNESVDQHDSSGGSKMRRGGAAPIVDIDLSRVLFQLRLKMVSIANVSDKRQMELQLLGLLEKLATLVPKWIHLRKAPSSLSGAKNTGGGNGASALDSSTSNHKLNIRQSIIVIRNDSVDYASDVRAKLGGRVHTAIKSNNEMKSGAKKGNKRTLQEMEQAVGVADAIVPPSFRRMYGKALGLDEGYVKDGK